MSVGFGFSVGDFLAVLKLVGTLIDALRESSKAGSSLRSLISELYALESALLRVKRLDLDVSHVEKVALRQAASQCQRSIDTFYKKIQKYQPHLQPRGTDSRIKDAWAKINWATCKKDDLETFRAEIRGHTSSIEILLLTVHMEATTMHTRKQDSQHRSLAGRIQDFSCQAIGILGTITDSVAQSVQQGKALLESSVQVVQTNLRIFQMVHDIQLLVLRIPGQIQRQQPVYLTDPLNRESPFHLEFVRSTEALLAVLKVNLKDSGCGPIMIDRGEFAIEESGTQAPIDLTGSWDSCFYPGQRVTMSMIFEESQDQYQGSCPKCGENHEESTQKEITCITCGTVFRRIKEVIGDEQDARQTSDSDDESSPDDMSEISVYGPARPENDDSSANLRKFRRIQVINKGFAAPYEYEADLRFSNLPPAILMQQAITDIARSPRTEKLHLLLCKLKIAVDRHGGFDRVCEENQWPTIARQLYRRENIESSESASLKNLYREWIDDYEKYMSGVASSKATPRRY